MELTSKTLFVFDTNVWLELYQLPPSAIRSIINAIQDKYKYFFLPNQVYLEYNKHVNRCRDNSLNRFKNLSRDSCMYLSDTKNKINQEFENLKKKCITEAMELQREFCRRLESIQTYLKEQLAIIDTEYQAEFSLIGTKDDIITSIVELLRKESRTQGFMIMELLKIYEEGELRYKYNIAPGHLDQKKKNESDEDYLFRKYGDLILWKEILGKIEGTEVNLVIVQNEIKPDWWELRSSKRIARVLEQEFEQCTIKESKFIMVDFEEFINKYGISLGLPSDEIQIIVSRYKLEKAVYNHLLGIKNSIIENYVNREYDCDSNSRISNILEELTVFGGSVSDVEDVAIQKIDIADCEVSTIDWISCIMAVVQLTVSANVSSYINPYVVHRGKVSITLQFEILLDFTIDYSNIAVSPDDAYEITNCSIENEEVCDLNTDEYDIDVAVDEDLFRDR